MSQTCQRPTFVDYDIVAIANRATTHAAGMTTIPSFRNCHGYPPYGGIAEVAALRFSPLDPFMFLMQAAAAYAHFLASRDDMVSSWAEKATRDIPTFLLAICISATSNALAGRLEPAQKVMARTLKCEPDLRASNLKDLAPFRRAKDLANFANDLRKAGLPK